MSSQNSPRKLLIALADLVGAALLAVYLIVIGPLGVLRGPLLLGRGFVYVFVLAPCGLLARALRAAIDWRLGNFDSAIVQVEGIVAILENVVQKSPSRRSPRTVLGDLYTLLARAYMHAGHIDDAMSVVIRAKKSINIERLPGMMEMDAKTAHLVRAGLAAGKLLDNGGMATLFVKTDRPLSGNRNRSKSLERNGGGSDLPQAPGKTKSLRPPSERRGSDEEQSHHLGAKIIPFPSANQLLT